MTSKEQAVLASIVLCDLVIEDKMSSAKSFIGVRNELVVRQIPMSLPRLFAVATLFDGAEKKQVELRITQPDKQDSLRLESELIFSGPEQATDMVVEILSLPLLQEGIYQLTLFVEGQYIGQRSFPVRVTSDTRIG